VDEAVENIRGRLMAQTIFHRPTQSLTLKGRPGCLALYDIYQMRMNFPRILIISALCIFLAGCDKNVVYKAHEDIDDGLWYIKNTPTFKVEITDTLSAYNLYYLVRNAVQYPYYNLYLTRKTTDPAGKKTSSLEEVFLSNQVTGKPFGTGLGDLFDHKIAFAKNYKFPRSGTYTIALSQSMRQNPLPFIISVGISVEKVAPAQK
jgi:gliding motility-associated lipoprotein GldH